MMTNGLAFNAFWTLANGVTHQIAQLTVIVTISRFLGIETLGDYTIASAISAPIVAISTLGMRNVQASDVDFEFPLFQFRKLQLVSSCTLFFGLLVAVVLLANPPFSYLVPVTFLCQAINTQRDTLAAHFQRLKRMEISAANRIVTTVATTLITISVLSYTSSLFHGMAALAISRLLAYRLWEMPLARQYDHSRDDVANLNSLPVLARIGLPLGMALFLSTLETSIPRYALSLWDGKESVGVMAIAMTVSLPFQFVISSLGQASVPHLRYGSKSTKILLSNLGFGLGVGTIGAIVVWTCGPLILRAFGVGYAMSTVHLLVLGTLVGAICATLNTVQYLLVATGRHRQILILAVASMVCVLAGAFVLIPTYGVVGAVLVTAFGRFPHVMLGTRFLVSHVRQN